MPIKFPFKLPFKLPSKYKPLKDDASSNALDADGTSDSKEEKDEVKKNEKKNKSLDKEFFLIALPTLATLAVDPIAGLVDSAYMGKLGSADLAGVGVALSIYNTFTRLLNQPLLSVTTSKVAASLSATDGDISAVASSSLAISLGMGVFEASIIGLGFTALASLWGAGTGSAIHDPTVAYLHIRALGAPMAVLSTTLQGIYRGLQDTRTPLMASIATNVMNIGIAPLLIFALHWGVKGAAAGAVIAQAIPTVLLLGVFARRIPLKLVGASTMAGVLKMSGPTGFMMLRAISVAATFSLATSLAARGGAVAGATHQVCFQLWMAASLLGDSVAVSAQAMLAKYIGAGDMTIASRIIKRALALSMIIGITLAAIMGIFGTHLMNLFSSDPDVRSLSTHLIPIIALTQPINAMAFVWDGFVFGFGGFRYASIAMFFSAAPSIGLMLLLFHFATTELGKLHAVWAGLIMLMSLRAITISVPYLLKRGPYKVMRQGAESYKPLATVSMTMSVLSDDLANRRLDTMSTAVPDGSGDSVVKEEPTLSNTTEVSNPPTLTTPTSRHPQPIEGDLIDIELGSRASHEKTCLLD